MPIMSRNECREGTVGKGNFARVFGFAATLQREAALRGYGRRSRGDWTAPRVSRMSICCTNGTHGGHRTVDRLTWFPLAAFLLELLESGFLEGLIFGFLG